MSAIVLLSGGQDSSTCLAIASAAEQEVYALSFDYGQRHLRELECAHKQAEWFDVKEHIIIKQDIPVRSGLKEGTGISVPCEWNADQGPAPTIVPGRNGIFLMIAAGIAESRRIDRIYCGVSAIDYSGYPDCRPEFIKAISEAIYVSSQGRVQVVTPLLNKTKSQMVQIGTALGVDWKNTWTCYRGGEQPCGDCPSCKLRVQAFIDAGMSDPAPYDPFFVSAGPVIAKEESDD